MDTGVLPVYVYVHRNCFQWDFSIFFCLLDLQEDPTTKTTLYQDWSTIKDHHFRSNTRFFKAAIFFYIFFYNQPHYIF